MKKEYTPVRLSHLLRHCSVGAIMRSSEYLVTIKDTNHWVDSHGNFTGRIIPYVEQVKKSLGIEQDLREPPTGSLDYDGSFDEQSGHYIPAMIFPSWFVCPQCHLLRHKETMALFNKNAGVNMPVCKECGINLEQVNLVQVDERGYMSDVPWYRIAHFKQKYCDWNKTKLKWNSRKNEVFCTCGASHGVNLSQLRYYQGYEQPWLLKKVDEKECEYEGKTSPTAYIMEVNDTRVHTPINDSALVIPPESRLARDTLVDKLYRHAKKEELMHAYAAGEDIDELKHQLRFELECGIESLNQAILDIYNGYPMFSHVLQSRDLTELEYEALITPLDFKDDENFVTHHFSHEFRDLVNHIQTPVSQKMGRLIDKVIAVNKLKEILVFKGFTRGVQANVDTERQELCFNGESENTLDDNVIPPDLGAGLDWLPALELYGEGVFITLNNEYLVKWEYEPRVIARCHVLAERYKNSPFSHLSRVQKNLAITPRFLLLHAFSHILIKELESLAGYPAASLKEKIYSSSNLENPMSGILIYTTIADIQGTLGGLAELSEPKHLLQILTRVYERMQWCSLDPVCSGHHGQGPSLLNLAACHACLLLPETSCMCGNVLLDRMMLKGSHDLPSIFDVFKSG